MACLWSDPIEAVLAGVKMLLTLWDQKLIDTFVYAAIFKYAIVTYAFHKIETYYQTTVHNVCIKDLFCLVLSCLEVNLFYGFHQQLLVFFHFSYSNRYKCVHENVNEFQLVVVANGGRSVCLRALACSLKHRFVAMCRWCLFGLLKIWNGIIFI